MIWLTTGLNSNNVAWFLMGDFLRLREIFLAHFVAHCESYVQDVENAVLVIRVCYCSFLRERKIVLPHFVFFFLDNSEIPATPWT